MLSAVTSARVRLDN